MKARHQNRREVSLALPENMIDNPFAAALNSRLKIIEEQLAASAGLRGTMAIAKQKNTDTRNIVMPGLTLESNRIADVADPVDDQDVVTKAYLKRYLNCDVLSDILENCPDFLDLLRDEGELNQTPTTPAVIIPVQWFWCVYVFTPAASNLLGPAAATAGNVSCYEFTLPFTCTITNITTEVTTARAGTSRYSVGIYASVTGARLVDTGPLTAAATGVRQDPVVGGPVTLQAGTYVFAQTTNDTLIANRCFPESIDMSIINKTYRRWGTAVNGSTGGQLPTTLGGLNAFATNRPILAALCE